MSPIRSLPGAEPSTGEVHRPLSVVDVLDRSAALYRANFGLFFGIALLAGGIYFVLEQIVYLASPLPPLKQLADSDTLDGLAPLLEAYGAGSSVGIVAWFLNLWASAALVYAISRRHVGLPVTLRESLRASFDRIPYLLVTTLALSAIMAVAGVALAIPMLAAGALAAVWTAVGGVWIWPLVSVLVVIAIGLLLAALVGILWCWLHPATVVIERRSILDALRRSRELMRERGGGRPWAERSDVRLSIVLSAIPLVAVAAGSLAMLPFLVASAIAVSSSFVDFGDVDSIMRLAMPPLLATQVAATALIHPFAMAVTVLFYYDLRYRHEGLDLELRAIDLRAQGRAAPRGDRA